jgi:mannose-6-phosphate isomerase-like protein (cupin superfamily)
MRSEHWTVVDGEAEILLGEDVLIATADDSVYIPAGTLHALKPAGEAPAKVIAVHFGDVVNDAEDMVEFS